MQADSLATHNCGSSLGSINGGEAARAVVKALRVVRCEGEIVVADVAHPELCPPVHAIRFRLGLVRPNAKYVQCWLDLQWHLSHGGHSRHLFCKVA